MFTGCLDENTIGCPDDMRLVFYLSDIYEPSANYDSKVGNDITLYIFKDKRLTYKNVIPYSEIEGGKEYVIRKTPDISGNLELIAWAVPKPRLVSGIPDYQIGYLFDDQLISYVATRAETHFVPLEYDIHLGSASAVEPIDAATTHSINMLYAPCRVEVRIRDIDDILEASTSGNDMHVLTQGVMSQMNLRKQGVGSTAIVNAPLSCPSGDGENYTTGRFGVLPSAAGQTVSVKVMSNDKEVVTLTVPQGTLPKGAESGDLLIFEYTLGDPFFVITIADYTVKIEIVEGM